MNKVIGIIIIALYFGKKYLCDFLYPTDINKNWLLSYSILSIIIVLSIKYKESSTFIEKLFISMVINNAYVMIFKQEYTYTLNDVWFIAIFTVAQYLRKEKKNDEAN
jgi:hypothetical protein